MQTWNGRDWDPARFAFDPFPWQARLLREVASSGRWPDLLDLPTGSGKTAAIDVAVFHLALQAHRGEDRRAAMRIAFVVDRRLVVDEAFHRARRLADALVTAVDNHDAPDVVRRTALRLRGLAAESRPPLIARSLRGGVPREDDWALTPSQPTVLCSTVDQVGSRLLFRGYGIVDRAKSIHAGLLGSDSLILLDEAHLSQPFRQTARAIATVPLLRGPDAGRASFHVALLSATPGEENADEWRFCLGEADRDNPVLARRLNATKPAVLVEVGSGYTARAIAAADQALGLMERMKAEGVDAPVVGVVLNRIARARDAFQRLRTDLGEGAVTLVIGRARSIDRDQIARDLDSIKTGIVPRPTQPHVIVATQTLEAGVDIDLDALVTDAASLDALRQRFGRMNRAGRDVGARGVILVEKADRNEKKPDPIYGQAIAKTLNALFPHGGEVVDFGIAGLNATLDAAHLTGPVLQPLLSDAVDAPVLMRAHVDLWSNTSPVPSSDPDPALFLHGPNREPASVQVVWRSDLGFGEDVDPADGVQSERLKALLALVPPRAAEAIELSAWAARRWLQGDTGLDLADVAQAEPTPALVTIAKAWPAFRWKGVDDDRSRLIRPDDIRPGDVIVVPSSYGGCDIYGWAPNDRRASGEERLPTPDVYDRASAPFAGKRYVVRIAPGLVREAVFAEADKESPDPAETLATRRKRLEAKSDRLAAEVRVVLSANRSSRAETLIQALAEILPYPLKDQLAALARRKKHRIERPAFPYDDPKEDPTGVVLVAPFGIEGLPRPSEGGTVSTEDDEAASFIGHAQSLKEHSGQVEAKARAFALSSGLSEALSEDLALAGWLHDAGKADLRFQSLLYDGDLLAMEAGAPRAKSARGRAAPGAKARAKLPDHWRHEALSVRLALANPRLHQADDRGLVLWLVGVHHGLGRPFFPHVDLLDEKAREVAAVEGLSEGPLGRGPGPQSLGFVIPDQEIFAAREGRGLDDDLRGLEWTALFRDLKRRYGPWGLARLEAVLRLADHRASEAARNGDSEP